MKTLNPCTRTNMKTRSVPRLFPYVAVSVGLCLWVGCGSQETPKTRAGTSEAQPEKAEQEPGNIIKSADQVPVAVRQAFQAKFPSVKLAEWKIKSDKNYEAEFTLQETEIAAKFDPAGKWLETECEIPASEVPQAVQDTVFKQFKDYKTVETQSVESWNDQRLIYELHLDNGKVIVKAQFSADGIILNQSTKPKS